ncbi:MAG: two-component system response regulator [Marivirga sp.]|nr:two-component system response regulator [Marivirga sp.]
MSGSLTKIMPIFISMKSEIFILLVEDDPDDVDLMQEALVANKVSYEIEIINQGDRVIPYLKVCKKFPDVLILDLNIPKLHGREVLKQIKTSDDLMQIPVAILTTSSSPAERENCLSMGADIFMTKPSSVNGFNEMVTSILNIAVKVSR